VGSGGVQAAVQGRACDDLERYSGVRGYGEDQRLQARGRLFQAARQVLGEPGVTGRGRALSTPEIRAWRDGFASEVGLPDPEEESGRYYERLAHEWGIDRTTARTFAMKSRQLVGWAAYEPRDIERVAVVVVESTSVGIIRESEVIEALKQSAGQTIYEFLARARLLEPRLESAREIGY
jgi:hypothetical protein